ncbi:MAG: HD domain-containing protein [Clostridiaceae bacterium]|nr:HD domain-containing protein [Clostridiaceae bacterium]
MLPRLLKEEQEKLLSPFAARNTKSRGRAIEQDKCTVRTDFERDTGRIIFSMEFRRLRHKTQVFFNPQNDHICTRMEHVIYVNYISNTIGKALGLNSDLIQAIALGHDLGHAPFGHTGEKVLRRCLKKVDETLDFQHELHSLRVVDLLAEKNNRRGLNLTFEVRDGIASHCGERYNEFTLQPNRNKKTEDLIPRAICHGAPATLEGCVVRMADKIAYVGRDIEDAARAGIMEFDDLPAAIRTALGRTNGEIINTLVTDIIANSFQQDAIILSPEKGLSMEELLKENFNRIYRSEKIARYEKMAENVIEGLFEALYQAASDPEKLARSKNGTLAGLADYLREHPGPDGEPLAQRITDYIAGMSDNYATKKFESIYWI